MCYARANYAPWCTIGGFSELFFVTWIVFNPFTMDVFGILWDFNNITFLGEEFSVEFIKIAGFDEGG